MLTCFLCAAPEHARIPKFALNLKVTSSILFTGLPTAVTLNGISRCASCTSVVMYYSYTSLNHNSCYTFIITLGSDRFEDFHVRYIPNVKCGSVLEVVLDENNHFTFLFFCDN